MPRMSADDRRALIVDAAIREFARRGLHGTSVEDIAKQVGVSQPYVFRLFGTKKDLFLAATEHCFDNVRDAFNRALREHPQEDALTVLGDAYMEMLAQR